MPLPAQAEAEAEEQWEFKKKKAGIEIYVRPVAGSQFKEFKAVTTVKSNLRRLSAMLLDPKTMSEWMYVTESIQIVEQINPTESIRYVISNFPWPTKDRDIIIKTRLSQHTDLSVHMLIESIEDHPTVNKNPDMIRAKHLTSSVRFFPESEGLIRIEYAAHYDPSGKLPSYLYNLLLLNTPYQTLIDLQKWMVKDIYNESRLSFITEPTD